MKDRHIKVAGDTKLLRSIYQRVAEQLPIDDARLRRTLWTKFILFMALATACYVSVYLWHDPLWFVFSFVGYGFAILLLAFNFAHDFSHGTVFRNSWWNDTGFLVIYTLNGAHAEAWKKRHVESHHFAPNVAGYDSDLEITDLIRVVPGSPCKWYHRFQHVYAPLLYTTYSLYWVLIKDFAIYFSTITRHPGKYHISFWLQKGFYFFYILLMPLSFSAQPWALVLLAFVIMHLTQSLFLLFTFFMTHHVEGLEYPATDGAGVITSSWFMNQVKSSNDMHPFSPTANFILGGFNNHIAHHLFPHVHHVYYPKLNEILYDALIEKGIFPNQTTYLEGIWSHLRHLRNMRVLH